jgi:farnesyl diphosphate synthase
MTTSLPDLRSPLAQFDAALRKAVAAMCEAGPERLHQALQHAVLNGGKRIRPALCLHMGRLWNQSQERVLPLALAIELVHAQSLVHDDLPCMDDDIERRGQPTVHVAFDEATAVLVGDALLAHAFAVLTQPHTDLTEAEQAALVLELSHTYQQLVSGQMLDIAQGAAHNTATLEQINRLKTAALFRFCFWGVGRLAAMPPQELLAWAAVGQWFGMLFQACDDWHDTAWATPQAQAEAAKAIQEQHQDLTQAIQAVNPMATSVLALLAPVLPPPRLTI